MSSREMGVSSSLLPLISPPYILGGEMKQRTSLSSSSASKARCCKIPFSHSSLKHSGFLHRCRIESPKWEKPRGCSTSTSSGAEQHYYLRQQHSAFPEGAHELANLPRLFSFSHKISGDIHVLFHEPVALCLAQRETQFLAWKAAVLEERELS